MKTLFKRKEIDSWVVKVMRVSGQVIAFTGTWVQCRERIKVLGEAYELTRRVQS